MLKTKCYDNDEDDGENNIEDKLVGTKIPFFFIFLCLLLGNAYREYESREKHLRNYIFHLNYFILQKS